MLAHTYDGPSRVGSGGWLKSVKYDGVRAVWDGGRRLGSLNRRADGVATGLWSRYGGAIQAPSWWLKALPSGVCLDGELYSDRYTFQQLSGMVRRKTGGIEWHGIYLLVFDVVPLGCLTARRECDCPRSLDFPKGKWLISGADLEVDGTEGSNWFSRVECLERSKVVRPVEHLAYDLDLAIPSGQEGWVLRDPSLAYETARSWGLLKVKGSLDATARIVGLVEGKGRLEGMVGALTCEGSKGELFEIGTGLSDEDRVEARGWVGLDCDYTYMELTEDGMPRHPAFARLRGVK